MSILACPPRTRAFFSRTLTLLLSGLAGTLGGCGGSGDQPAANAPAPGTAAPSAGAAAAAPLTAAPLTKAASFAGQTLRVFNWSDYIDPELIPEFDAAPAPRSCTTITPAMRSSIPRC